MRYSNFILLSLALIFVSSTFPSTERLRKTIKLFNGRDLSGWDTYVGPLYDTIKKEFAGEPIGLNSDIAKVFSVVTEDGKPAIRISGENFGGISTQQEFTNYHLRLEFKWGKLKWHPKREAKRRLWRLLGLRGGLCGCSCGKEGRK
jgi:hypothetical protein